MELAIIRNIRLRIAAGQLTEALEQTTTLLHDPQRADWAQQLRTLQAENAQLREKARLRVISHDEEQVQTNKIIYRLESLLKTIEHGPNAVSAPVEAAPKQAWRYVFVGVVVALAIMALAWRLAMGESKSADASDCPSYGADKKQRVLILPLKKLDNKAKSGLDFDLSDFLNDAFKKDAQLISTAESDVHEAYNIESNYPNPSEAMAIGTQCGADMIVWGKVGASKDTIEVRYKHLKPKNIDISRDSMFDGLLTSSSEGVLTHDVQTVARLLYLIMAIHNGSSQQIAATLGGFEQIAIASSQTAKMDVLAQPLDTSTMFVLADAHRRLGDSKSAIRVYDDILSAYPDNKTALRLRGTLAYQRKDYHTAAHDYEALAPDPAKTDPKIQRVRADAYLKSGQPEKAQKDLDALQSKSPKDDKWLKMKQKEVADSTAVTQARAQRMDRVVARQPQNVSARLTAAQAHLGLGKEDKAIKNAQEVLKIEPQNLVAIQVAIDAFRSKGDTSSVRRVHQKAVQNGVDPNVIRTLRQ
jgi:tetratricopeptide (TPR) repeat protein